MNEGEEGDELEGPDVHRGRIRDVVKMTTMKMMKSSDWWMMMQGGVSY